MFTSVYIVENKGNNKVKVEFLLAEKNGTDTYNRTGKGG